MRKYAEMLETHLRQFEVRECPSFIEKHDELFRVVKKAAANLIENRRADELRELFEAVRVFPLGNNKARMGKVYRIIEEITIHLVQNGRVDELKDLFQVCVDYDFYERWRPYVLCCLARGLRQLDPDYAQGAWVRSLEVFKQIGASYDFWSAIPSILQLADDCNWLDAEVARIFHEIIQSAASRSSNGWEDYHLVDCLPWMTALESRSRPSPI